MLTRLLVLLIALMATPLQAWAGSVNSSGTCPGVTVTQGDNTIGCRSDNTAPANTVNDFGNKYNAHWHEYSAATLTNKTGGGLVAGDVVTISGSNDASVILSDIAARRRTYVVAQATIANDAAGEFARSGVVTVKCTGSFSEGAYLWKSATTKVVETTGVEQSGGATIPNGTVALALSDCTGGFALALWFPHVIAVDALIAGAGITLTPGVGTNTIAANVSGIDYQAFTASGTWTKVGGVTVCMIQAVGGGGSGGGGKSGATSNGGGSGGGGAAIATKFLKASDLGATESVTVATATTGGASNSAGAAGGASSFGTHLSAYGGGGGITGQTSNTATGGAGGGTGSVGDAGVVGAAQSLGGAPLRLQGMSIGGGGAGSDGAVTLVGSPAEYGGGSGGGSANNTAGSAGGTSLYCGAAGGGGGSGGAGVANNGAAGGASGTWTQAGGGGGANGTGGASPTAGTAGAAGTTAKCGAGGGGGGGSITGGVTGGAGGDGGAPGGGGGGGGSGVAAGGVGGNGARGEVRAYCW